MESTLKNQRFGVDSAQCLSNASLVRKASFKDLPKPGVKIGKKIDAWSKSYESKGNMTVKKILLHPGEVGLEF